MRFRRVLCRVCVIGLAMALGGSLQQSLIAAASRWEQERSREVSTLRRSIQDANARADVESQKLRTETAAKLKAEARLRERESECKAEKRRADDLVAENNRHKLQAIGSFLLLSELRAHMKAADQALEKGRKPQPAALSLPSPAVEYAPAAEAAPTGDTACTSDGEEGEGASAAREDDAARKKREANRRKRARQQAKKAAERDAEKGGDQGDAAAMAADAGASPDDDNADHAEDDDAADDGAGTHLAPANATDAASELALPSAAASHALHAALSLVEPLPPLVSEADLVTASREGKGRMIEGFLAIGVIGEVAEARAQDALVASLEAGVSEGRIAVVKSLIEAGVEAQRTEALYAAG